MTADVLLFDLGGVVIDWVGVRELQRLTGDEESEVRRRLAACEAVRRYETGACDRAAFAEAFLRDWGLPHGPQSFLALYASWIGRPYDGALEALERLRPRFRLACLSNTNEMHWELLTGELGVGRAMDACFASHLLGVAKPEAACFRRVLDGLGVRPSEVRFFDDSQANVAAAAALGIESHLVDPRVGVAPTLRALGLDEAAATEPR